MSISFPKIYPILDSAAIPQANRKEFLHKLASELAEAGVTLLEYRNKTGSESELLTDAAILRAAFPACATGPGPHCVRWRAPRCETAIRRETDADSDKP